MKYLRMSEDLSNVSLTDLIKTQDELSEQILEITSSIKAREECISWLEKKLSDDEISFE